MIAVAYLADGKRLFSGQVSSVTSTLRGVDAALVRVLDGTELSNMGTVMDPRLPETLAEFDAAYPAAGRWAAP